MANPRWSTRLAGPGDAEEVARLLHDFNTEFDTPSPGAEVLAARLHTLLGGPHTIAVLSGEPVLGLALLTLRPNVWYPGPVPLLDELYVVPDRRRQGIGSCVVERVVAVCRALGASVVEVNVDEPDVDALRFYQRHGFSLTEPGTSHRALYLTRVLDPTP